MNPASTLASIRTCSTRLRRIIEGQLTALLLLLALEYFGSLAIRAVMRGPASVSGRELAMQIVAASPGTFYLFALAGVRRALAEFGDGKLFAPTIARMLKRVGTWLTVGAVASFAVVPAAAKCLGFDHGYWIAFDVSAWVLWSIGLSFHVIARVIEHGADMKAELDEIF